MAARCKEERKGGACAMIGEQERGRRCGVEKNTGARARGRERRGQDGFGQSLPSSRDLALTSYPNTHNP